MSDEAGKTELERAQAELDLRLRVWRELQYVGRRDHEVKPKADAYEREVEDARQWVIAAKAYETDPSTANARALERAREDAARDV